MAPQSGVAWRSWPVTGMVLLLALGALVVAVLAGSSVKQEGFMAAAWGFLAASSVWGALGTSWYGGTRRAGLWWMAGAEGSVSAGQALQALQRAGRALSWVDPLITGLSVSAVLCILISSYFCGAARDRQNQ